MTGTPKLCPQCHQPMSYALQPGGKPPLTWRCLACEMPDPLTSPELKALMKGLLKHMSQ
ncbi:hypothetical protein ACVWXN_000125 [Bradyrhizobium sp. i1.4.4]|uniref:hypothetical protein n=1 Tax=Bradyrhizobium TaxID=374 RepID=UPI0013747CB4|nr:hypothetical protein [Bradyrhizobium japonicum]